VVSWSPAECRAIQLLWVGCILLRPRRRAPQHPGKHSQNYPLPCPCILNILWLWLLRIFCQALIFNHVSERRSSAYRMAAAAGFTHSQKEAPKWLCMAKGTRALTFENFCQGLPTLSSLARCRIRRWILQSSRPGVKSMTTSWKLTLLCSRPWFSKCCI